MTGAGEPLGLKFRSLLPPLFYPSRVPIPPPPRPRGPTGAAWLPTAPGAAQLPAAPRPPSSLTVVTRSTAAPTAPPRPRPPWSRPSSPAPHPRPPWPRPQALCPSLTCSEPARFATSPSPTLPCLRAGLPAPFRGGTSGKRERCQARPLCGPFPSFCTLAGQAAATPREGVGSALSQIFPLPPTPASPPLTDPHQQMYVTKRSVPRGPGFGIIQLLKAYIWRGK